MQTSVQRLIATFEQAFQKLGVSVSAKKLEDLAITIHRAMTVQARHFHNLEHVFNFLNPDNPIQSLAALYHDIVYYQVDMGFSPAIWGSIAPYIHIESDAIYIVEDPPEDDDLLDLSLEVFNFRPGQKLSIVGELNEFFSALVMCKQLEGLVCEKDLVKMTLCIEATIPFRGRDANGESHFDVLERRLRQISQRRNLSFTEAEIENAIVLAVIFANKDIESFGETDPRIFIENTWKLLPEMNVALRASNAYSVRHYRIALEKMEIFLTNLNPANIFNQYRNTPSLEEYRMLTHYAYQNVSVAREYLWVKVLAVAVLEAFAELTGGDAPVSLFMGDFPDQRRLGRRIEDFLPERCCPEWLDHDSYLYRLLVYDTPGISSLDVHYSPLALFIYQNLPPDDFRRCLNAAHEMFNDQITPHRFLHHLGWQIVREVGYASAQMAPTRRDVLLCLVEQMEPEFTSDGEFGVDKPVWSMDDIEDIGW